MAAPACRSPTFGPCRARTLRPFRPFAKRGQVADADPAPLDVPEDMYETNEELKTPPPGFRDEDYLYDGPEEEEDDSDEEGPAALPALPPPQVTGTNQASGGPKTAGGTGKRQGASDDEEQAKTTSSGRRVKQKNK